MREEWQVRLLSLVDVLEPLGEEDLRDLARRCPGMRLDAGQDFYRPEIHDSGLFLILEGRVRVYATTLSGKETTLEPGPDDRGDRLAGHLRGKVRGQRPRHRNL